MVPIHIQAARQRVAEALCAHGLTLQHLWDRTSAPQPQPATSRPPPPPLPPYFTHTHSLIPMNPLTWEGLITTPRLPPW